MAYYFKIIILVYVVHCCTCTLCYIIALFDGSYMYRVSCMQVQMMEQHRCHWPPVRDPYPAWTVFWPETHTVAGTKLLGSVLHFLIYKGR